MKIGHICLEFKPFFFVELTKSNVKLTDVKNVKIYFGTLEMNVFFSSKRVQRQTQK